MLELLLKFIILGLYNNIDIKNLFKLNQNKIEIKNLCVFNKTFEIILKLINQ